MTEMISNASCLIRTRLREIGFPSAFSHYPEGMSAQEVQGIKEYADAALSATEELRGDAVPVRRVVLSRDGYLVLGVVCYLRTLLQDQADQYDGLMNGNRIVQGFVGLVWNMRTCKAGELPRAFPELRSFRKLLEDKILPNWAKSQNSIWAEQAQEGIPVPYGESAVIPAANAANEGFALNLSASAQCAGPLEVGDAMVQTAICQIVERRTGALSVCTNASLGYAQQPFMNVTNAECREISVKSKAAPRTVSKPFAEQRVTDIPSARTRDSSSAADRGGYGGRERSYGRTAPVSPQPQREKPKNVYVIESDISPEELERLLSSDRRHSFRIADWYSQTTGGIIDQKIDEFKGKASEWIGFFRGRGEKW